jgi:hypothetical protein
MKTPAVVVARISIVFLSAWMISQRGFDYWAGGLAFGQIVLAASARRVDDLWSAAGLGFVASSVLIAVAAGSLLMWGYLHVSEWQSYCALPPLPAALMMGTLLLPAAHAALLKASWQRAGLAIVGITLASTLAVWIASPSLLGLALVWQASYILFMFAPPLRPARIRSRGAAAPSAKGGGPTAL